MDSWGEIVVRPAMCEDQSAIECIARSAFAVYIPRMDRKPFPMLDDYAKHIENGFAFVLADEANVLGYIVLLPREGYLLLDNMAVSQCVKGSGFGRILMQFADEYALKLGYRQIRVYTNEAMHENLNFYPHFGYSFCHRAEENGYKRIYFVKNLSS